MCAHSHISYKFYLRIHHSKLVANGISLPHSRVRRSFSYVIHNNGVCGHGSHPFLSICLVLIYPHSKHFSLLSIFTSAVQTWDPTNMAPLCLFQLCHFYSIYKSWVWLDKTPNEPSQTRRMKNSSFVLHHDRPILNAGILLNLNLSCNHRLCKWYNRQKHMEDMLVGPFCRGKVLGIIHVLTISNGV